MIPPRTDVSLARPKTLCGSGGSGTLRIPRQGVGQFPTLLALGLLIVSSRAAIAEQRTVTLAIGNMYCETCPYIVKKTIEKASGVSKSPFRSRKKRQSLCSMMRGQRSRI
jgi:mercuric ion binding protein